MTWGCNNNNNNNNNNYQSCAAAESWKSWISNLSVVLLRDAEKETHKHKVLWEKCLCTSNRVGVNGLDRIWQFAMWKQVLFDENWKSRGGQGGRGAIIIAIITFPLFHRRSGLKIQNFLSLSRCTQGCKKSVAGKKCVPQIGLRGIHVSLSKHDLLFRKSLGMVPRWGQLQRQHSTN